MPNYYLQLTYRYYESQIADKRTGGETEDGRTGLVKLYFVDYGTLKMVQMDLYPSFSHSDYKA